MSAMSRNSSNTSLAGFSVYQPFIGASLQFLPALGTPELDTMIDSYVPGFASMQEKRAIVSMDFCEHAMLTGETFKYYTVPMFPNEFVNVESPASSAAVQDSGYGSAFDVSPVISDLGFPQSAMTPTSSSQASTSSKPTPQKSRSPTVETTDFSHLPGMKIMTKDGLDVTHSASRGCKTKEQRDHAHLMRILKACDACKKKKIRCDPSHRKNIAATKADGKAAKKTRTITRPVSNESTRVSSPAFSTTAPIFPPNPSPSLPPALEAGFIDPCEQWLNFEVEEPVVDRVSQGYDFFFDPAGYFSTPTAPTRERTAGMGIAHNMGTSQQLGTSSNMVVSRGTGALTSGLTTDDTVSSRTMGMGMPAGVGASPSMGASSGMGMSSNIGMSFGTGVICSMDVSSGKAVSSGLGVSPSTSLPSGMGVPSGMAVSSGILSTSMGVSFNTPLSTPVGSSSNTGVSTGMGLSSTVRLSSDMGVLKRPTPFTAAPNITVTAYNVGVVVLAAMVLQTIHNLLVQDAAWTTAKTLLSLAPAMMQTQSTSRSGHGMLSHGFGRALSVC